MTTDKIPIKKEKTWDDDPEDVFPPPATAKVESILSLPAPSEKSLYNDVTISNEEIVKLKKRKANDVPETVKAAYHNARLSQIESGIRKAIANEEKSVFFGSTGLDAQDKECWKRKILDDIAKKMVKKNVKAEFTDRLCCFEVNGL